MASADTERPDQPCVGCQNQPVVGRNPVDQHIRRSAWTRQDIEIAMTTAIVVFSLITLWLELSDRGVVA